ncbi:hypothetical protein M231_06099 [Tremella mesenterica]|uniref:Uncharacterized protein n=1 Tax=Tremella mesenterica TaxID=5217 RepID=A0A4Q1BEE1_TREME|nr:hypothetical protein M231_06099 [Tremella mesenterica]
MSESERWTETVLDNIIWDPEKYVVFGDFKDHDEPRVGIVRKATMDQETQENPAGAGPDDEGPRDLTLLMLPLEQNKAAVKNRWRNALRTLDSDATHVYQLISGHFGRSKDRESMGVADLEIEKARLKVLESFAQVTRSLADTRLEQNEVESMTNMASQTHTCEEPFRLEELSQNTEEVVANLRDVDNLRQSLITLSRRIGMLWGMWERSRSIASRVFPEVSTPTIEE